MKNWRQIFSYRIEPEDLPDGFGKDVIAHSENHQGSDYAGVCIYQNAEHTYAVWTEDPTGDEEQLRIDLLDMRDTFDANKEHYLEEVRKALLLPQESYQQHSVLADIKPNIGWLYTWKCEFYTWGEL
jgi:hypothetical protein